MVGGFTFQLSPVRRSAVAAHQAPQQPLGVLQICQAGATRGGAERAPRGRAGTIPARQLSRRQDARGGADQHLAPPEEPGASIWASSTRATSPTSAGPSTPSSSTTRSTTPRRRASASTSSCAAIRQHRLTHDGAPGHFFRSQPWQGLSGANGRQAMARGPEGFRSGDARRDHELVFRRSRRSPYPPHRRSSALLRLRLDVSRRSAR